MKLLFRRRAEPPIARDGMTVRAANGDDCAHDWLNWTEPTPATQKVSAGIFSESPIEREVLIQTRKCTKCNLFIRRMC